MSDQGNETAPDEVDTLATFLNAGIEHGEKVARATALLPALFVERMMTDEWAFGLLLTTGHIMAIKGIREVRHAADGTIWLDVMLTSRNTIASVFGNRVEHALLIPCDREKASINAACVAAAFELSDRLAMLNSQQDLNYFGVNFWAGAEKVGKVKTAKRAPQVVQVQRDSQSGGFQ